MKQQIIDNISILLLKNYFLVKTIKGCFDILARRGSNILLIKTLEDANALNSITIDYMKNIASTIGATPLIVSQKSGSKLRDNVIYTRLGISTISYNTFKNFLDKKPIFIRSNKAGLTVKINSEELKNTIEKENISTSLLSRKIGVSSSMIKKYENEDPEVSFTRAKKFYELFGSNVFISVDLTSSKLEEEVRKLSKFSSKYEELGFVARDTKKVPFDIIAKKNKEIILTKVGDKLNKDLFSMSSLLEADDLVIFSRKKPKDIASISQRDFLELVESEELIRIVKELN